MAEEMSHCESAVRDGNAQSEPFQGKGSVRPMSTLPTLQRNALCKIFDRPEYSPEEVAMLGLRRLQLAEGIGQKGLTEIRAWLKTYGYELKSPETAPGGGQPMQRKTRKNIEIAVRLLRTHGYVVQQDGENVSIQTSVNQGENSQRTQVPDTGH